MGNAADIKREMLATLSKTVAGTMRAACDSVVAATPIRTGRARASWILSLDMPTAAEPGPGVDTGPQDAGYAAIENYDISRDGPIYLVSNSDYMSALDDGWSPQAEPGFVTRAIMEGLNATSAYRPTVAKMLRGVAERAYLRGA